MITSQAYLNPRIRTHMRTQLIKDKPLVLFMKGEPATPMVRGHGG